jgi:hypothetical protein|tara:strand:+ start:604 stop:846 length:243 start_codon:yes stop_codon:yes gene_type:complete
MINVAHIGSGSISEYQIVTMESSTFKRVADFEALDTNMAAFYKTYRKILAVTYDVPAHDLILLPKMKSILKLWRSANDPT